MENFLKLIFAFGVGFILVLVAMPKVIPFLHKMKFGQVEREEGPESHKAKMVHQLWVELYLFWQRF